MEKESEGYFYVDEEVYHDISELVKKVLQHPLLSPILDRVAQTQYKVEFTYKDWLWKGFLDGLGQIILDIKYTDSSSTVSKVARQFFNMAYFIPATLYHYGVKVQEQRDLPVVYMTIDKTGSVFPMEISDEILDFGMRKVDYYVNELERCIKLDAWNMGPEFFATSENSQTIPLELPSYLADG